MLNFEVLDRKILDCFVKMIAGNIDIKGTSGEIPEGNEKHVIGNWKKSDPC